MRTHLLFSFAIFFLIFISSLNKLYAVITDSERAGESMLAPGGLDIWVDKPAGASTCKVTIKFTSSGVGDWIFSSVFGSDYPDLGRLKILANGNTINDGIPIPDGGVNNIKLEIAALSTDALLQAFKFQIVKGLETAIYTITVKNNCSVVTPTLSIVLTGADNPACIGPGDLFPKYNVEVTRSPVGPATPPQTYIISLSPPTNAMTSPFGINGSTTITIGAGQPNVIIPMGLGGQPSASAITSTYTVIVAEVGPALPLSATATVTIEITPACQKNVLLVKVDPKGGPPSPWTAPDDPINLMTNVQNWVKGASFNKAIFNPFNWANVIGLDEPFSFYNNPNAIPPTKPQIPITTLAQEVIKKILTPDETVLDKVKHLVLFLNTTTPGDIGPAGYWAVPEMIYQKPTVGTVKLGLSIHPRLNPTDPDHWKQVAHGIGHQLDLNDLTIFDNAQNIINQSVTPVDFDLMAIPASGIAALKNVQPLAETKFERSVPVPAWISTSGAPNVEFIDNSIGGVTTIAKTIIPSSTWDATSTKPVAIVLGLDDLSTTLNNEKVYVWIEARPNIPGKDEVGGNDKIVVYYANKYITSGAGQRVKWYDLESTAGIQFFHGHDPSITPGLKIGDSGWEINGVSIANGEYTVTVSYTKPIGTHDAWINNTGGWVSPDIKTVIGGCPSTTCKGTEVAGNIDTKVVATVRNSGALPADVVVEFMIGRTSVAGVADLSKTTFGTVFTTIPAGSSVECFSFLNLQLLEGISWGPTLINALKASPSASHYCLYVNVRPITPGDSDPNNNYAQRNVGFVENAKASPYPSIDYTFYVSNPDDVSRLVLFNTQNIASQWQFKLTPEQISLAPKETTSVNMHIEVPQDFPACTNFPIQIGAVMAVDHTLIPLGGIMSFVELREKTTIKSEVKLIPCQRDSISKYRDYLKTAVAGRPIGLENGKAGYDRETYGKLLDYFLDKIVTTDTRKEQACATLVIKGCTSPPRPNQEMTIIYQDPAGNPVFKDITTDAQGCFNDTHFVTEGGEWKTTAIYPGNGCYSSAKNITETNVPGPVNHDQDDDKRNDKDEVQGDEDGDNIPGQLDPDSDNDGIIDGNEPLGNYDCDSYDNMIDPDSDDDGTPDGKDQTPYGNTPLHRIFLSALYHRFDFDTKLPIKDASGFNLRAGVYLHPKWAIEAEFGLTSTQGVDNLKGQVYNLNLNGLYYFYNRPTVSPYLTAGLGALLFNDFPNGDGAFALNGGLGVIATQPNLIPGFALRAEIKGHYGLSGFGTNGNLNLQYSLGLLYRFKTKSTPCNIERRIRESRR